MSARTLYPSLPSWSPRLAAPSYLNVECRAALDAAGIAYRRTNAVKNGDGGLTVGVPDMPGAWSVLESSASESALRAAGLTTETVTVPGWQGPMTIRYWTV